MKPLRLLTTASFLCIAVLAMGTDKYTQQARIYVNPGHGGYTSNDRNFATINHELGDTTGFYETNTNLWKAQALRANLLKHNPDTVIISRQINNITSDVTIDGVTHYYSLTSIAAHVEQSNIDYFISIHSNGDNSDGTTTNYLLFLYRGTDDAVGSGLTDAKNMAAAAWDYTFKNEITTRSSTTTRVRGDASFYDSSDCSTTTNKYSGTSYYGYLGVLKHGADGYLVEGTFHTYQPERHRLLNQDYCAQEGRRYGRAIRAWFEGPEDEGGDIMGVVKDKDRSLENDLYTYSSRSSSTDMYYPLNNDTVLLKSSDGTILDTYITDDEYNGVFVFYDLDPGTYTLDFSRISGYAAYTETITVEANTTAFTTVLLSQDGTGTYDDDTDSDDSEVEYYAHPEQDDDVEALSNYTFYKEDETVTLSGISDEYTIRRALLRNDTLYVLAHKDTQTPLLCAFDPNTGALIKQISTSGIETDGYNSKEMNWTLSDIAFTNDGVLIGTNSAVVGTSSSYINGDFYMYAWQGDGNTGPADATPTTLTTLATNSSDNLEYAGNNYSNLMANSIAINGDFDDFYFYFDSHAGDAWDTDYGIRYVRWRMVNGSRTAFTVYKECGYTESDFGEDAMMTLSPTALDRLAIDGDSIYLKEFELSSTANEQSAFPTSLLDIQTSGANYFRYADAIFMVSPDYDSSDNSYGVKLYNITNGHSNAVQIGEYENLIIDDGLEYMAAFGVVDNADITLYLVVDDSIARVKTNLNSDSDDDDDDDTTATIESDNLTKVGYTRTASALSNLTVRRALLHDGYFYVLAHDSDDTPYLYLIDADDGTTTKEISTDDIETTGYNNQSMNMTLSDIAFTDDGVLIGTNSVCIGTSGNDNCNGDFYMYAWGADGVTAPEDDKPTQVLTLATANGNNISVAGNNNSNLMANSIAVDGDYDDFYFYFDSHAGNTWDTSYGVRYGRWKIEDGELTASATVANSTVLKESTLGSNTMMTLVPESDTILIDGETIYMTAVKPSFVDGTYSIASSASYTISTPFADTSLSIGTSGATFFSGNGTTYMASPVYTAGEYTYGVRLYDVTGGLGAAVLLSEYEDLITSDALEYMTACGVVRGDYIDIYLLVGNQIAQVSTRNGVYLCGPAVDTEGSLGMRWESTSDTYNALKLSYNSDDGYYYFADDDGNETAVSMTAGEQFVFSTNLDFTKSSYGENSVVPVDMSTGTSDSGYASSSTYEENAYALSSNDAGYGETQYFNVLSSTSTTSTASASFNKSEITPATFNLPTGDYIMRLYVDKTINDEKLTYYIIKDRKYRFYDPGATNNLGSYQVYKSFYDCHAVVIPSDIDVFYVASVTSTDSTSTAALVQIDDTGYTWGDDELLVLPAYTPVILATEESDDSYAQMREMEYYVDNPNLTVSTLATSNILVGQLDAVTIPQSTGSKTNYLFGYHTDDGVTTVGFYRSKGTGKCSVNSAYLQVDSTLLAKGISLAFEETLYDDDDDTATSIDTATLTDDSDASVPGDDAYYTLQGVRIGEERPVVRGVYIRNGRKVVVK